MKKRNSKLLERILFLGTIIVVAVTLLFSCKKNSIDVLPQKNDMSDATKIVDGDLLTGNVTIESDENEVALNYKNGNKFILIAKIPNTPIANITDMQSAEVITSKYGIILKDLSSDKVFFLINNDSESIKRFETVQSLFTTNFQSAKIFGTTIVNSEKI